jgi:soluble lytic murein transglycosylase-like protein
VSRLLAIGLMGVGLVALSCETGPARLPDVAAASPAVREDATGAEEPRTAPPAPEPVAPAAARAAELPSPSPREAAVARVRTRFDGLHTGLSEHELDTLAETIVDEAARHDVELELVMAVIRVESSGYNFAVSPVGALGLMQLMPPTGEELAGRYGIDWRGPDTLFDPSVNVKLGIAYLRELSDRFGDVNTALAAYNWGPGRIHRRIRRGASVPRLYVSQVRRAYASAEVSRPAL